MTIKELFTDQRTERFRIGLRDAIFSLYYAIGGTVGAALVQSLNTGSLPTLEQIKVAAIAGLVVGLQHIVRKYFTGPKQ